MAQAAVPQASVSPAPRSQTRSLIASRPVTCATEMLARSGNSGWFSSIGPIRARSKLSGSCSTKNTACGLPMFTAPGECSDRIVDRADLQLDPPGVGERLGQGDLVPGEPRPAHIHGEGPLRRRGAPPSRPRPGLQDEPAALGRPGHGRVVEHRVGDAARAAAAGARFRAVGVVDAHERVRARAHGIVQDHQLIEGRAGILRDRPRLLGLHLRGGAAQIQHHDRVAGAVHLQEASVGECAHAVPRLEEGAGYIAKAAARREGCRGVADAPHSAALVRCALAGRPDRH